MQVSYYALLLAAGLIASSSQSAEVVTVSGNGQEAYSGDGGPATRAAIGQPFGLTIGPDSALYVCSVANHVVRRVDMGTGSISTVAGTGEKGYAGDGGPAVNARLNEPYEVRFDSAGHLYFVEMQNHVVRRVDRQTKIISTLAGTGERGFSGDGGPAVKARLSIPHSIALDNAHTKRWSATAVWATGPTGIRPIAGWPGRTAFLSIARGRFTSGTVPTIGSACCEHAEADRSAADTTGRQARRGLNRLPCVCRLRPFLVQKTLPTISGETPASGETA